jgi:sugar O-acyltransferase (sialic acid O-acetyltransferase NeuD family)
MKNKSLIIFGAGEIAELAFFYFKKYSEYRIEAFTIDEEYISQNQLLNLPIIPFNEISKKYPTNAFDFFVALSYSKLNSIRKDKYNNLKILGYHLASFISPQATILSNSIGDNCFILENNVIQPYVTIGNNVTLWSGNHVGHHSTIKDHNFISSHVVISGSVTINEQCFIGVNATIRDHINIGEKSIIGAGAIILRDVEANGLYIGQGAERSKIPSFKLKDL